MVIGESSGWGLTLAAAGYYFMVLHYFLIWNYYDLAVGWAVIAGSLFFVGVTLIWYAIFENE